MMAAHRQPATYGQKMKRYTVTTKISLWAAAQIHTSLSRCEHGSVKVRDFVNKNSKATPPIKTGL